MAITESNAKRAAIRAGATWGTAVALDSSSGGIPLDGEINWSATQGVSQGVDVNAKALTHSRRTDLSTSVSISGEATYDGSWPQLLYSVLRTGSYTPTEQNTGEGDYQHVLAKADPTAIPFYTVGLIGDDGDVLEFPSVQFQSLTWSHAVNAAAQVQVEGIADRFVKSGATNAASVFNTTNLTANTDYEPVCLGGANHYFRLGKADGALSSSDDKIITNYSISLTRNESTNRATRGVNSPYVLQPRQVGRFTGQLSVTLKDADEEDVLQEWLDGTIEAAADYYQAEIFVDGSQIGSGDNRSVKWNFPFMAFSAERPTSFNRTYDGNISEVTITFDLMSSGAIGSVSGQPNSSPATCTIVNEKTSAYT